MAISKLIIDFTILIDLKYNIDKKLGKVLVIKYIKQTYQSYF